MRVVMHNTVSIQAVEKLYGMTYEFWQRIVLSMTSGTCFISLNSVHRHCSREETSLYLTTFNYCECHVRVRVWRFWWLWRSGRGYGCVNKFLSHKVTWATEIKASRSFPCVYIELSVITVCLVDTVHILSFVSRCAFCCFVLWVYSAALFLE